jgi:hypothetical protein
LRERDQLTPDLVFRDPYVPVGLILCAGKKRETVEVLELEPRGIYVAEYLMELPPRGLLEQHLREAMARTRLWLDQQTTSGIGSH